MYSTLRCDPMRSTCLAVVLLGVVGAADLRGEATPPVREEVSPVITGLEDAIRILEDHHLPLSADAARKNVVEALIRTSDSKAMILSRESAARMEKGVSGILFDAGLGVSMSNGMARITSVSEGSPAATAGVKVGDILQAIGDTMISSTGVMPVTGLLRAEEETTLLLKLKREGDDQLIELDVPLQERQLDAVAEIRKLPAELGYVRVNGLYPGCGDLVARTLRAWADAGMFGVVLDLRRAAGQDLDSVAAIANLVAEPNSLLFSLHDIAKDEVQAVRSEAGKALGMPMLVLVNEETRRASEVLAATLQGSGKGAILVGTVTAGDPEIRQPIRLTDGQLAYVATKHLITADGTTYEGDAGVVPDMEVERKGEKYREYIPDQPLLTDPRETTDEEREAKRLKEAIRGDTMLIRAVDVLLGLKALNIRGYGHAQGIGH